MRACRAAHGRLRTGTGGASCVIDPSRSDPARHACRDFDLRAYGTFLKSMKNQLPYWFHTVVFWKALFPITS